MKHALVALIVLILAAAPLQAACYADYKAKKDNPLQLHYGVVELPDSACGGTGAAQSVIAGRLRDGWTLLQVISVFGQEGLNERRGRAGEFFLRY
ncbi:MAG: hypothetical protein AAF919_14520 [Pseudomonadota bacterium]